MLGLGVVLLCLFLTTFVVADRHNRVYTASLSPIQGSGVSGRVVVFAATGDTVAFSGFASGLQANLKAANCTAEDACGAHIHAGTSCDSLETQGDHLFVSPVTQNPWTIYQYETDATGAGTFSGIVTQGTSEIQDRVFIVHAQDGSRVACGMLNEVLLSSTATPIFFTSLASYPGSSVNGFVTTILNANGFGQVCIYASVNNLQPNLNSVYGGAGGTDCQAANGCGMHIHDQLQCTSADEVGPLFFSGSTDPWTQVGYRSTTAAGTTQFVDCVDIGSPRFSEDPTFVVHNNEGAAVACGVLSQVVGPSGAPTRSPTRAPTTEAPTTETAFPTLSTPPTTETAFPTKTLAPVSGPAGPAPGPPGGSSAVSLLPHGHLLITACLVTVAGLFV